MNWIIDRLEEQYAIMENPKTGETIQEKRNKLPKETKEGDIIIQTDNTYKIDKTQTQIRTEMIKDKFEKLKKK